MRRSSGLRALAGALLLIAASTSLAMLQETPVDSAPVRGSVAWWLRPVVWGERGLTEFLCDLNAVAVDDQGRVWVAGSLGLIAWSDDEGRSWTKGGIDEKAVTPIAPSPPPPSPGYSPPTTRQAPPKDPNFYTPPPQEKKEESPPANKESGKKAAGLWPGVVHAAAESQVTGNPPESGVVTEDLLLMAAFGRTLKVLDRDGNLYVSDDRAKTWTVKANPDYLKSFLATFDSSATLLVNPPSTTKAYGAYLVDTVDGQFLYAVGVKGTLGVGFTLGGVKTYAPPTKVDLYAAFATDTNHAWIVGDRGTILKTENRAQSWVDQSVPSAAASQLRGVVFDKEGKSGWAVGTLGTILHTTDGGTNWLPASKGAQAKSSGAVTQAAVFPAPWYYLTWIAAGLLLVRAARRPTEAPPEESIADVLIADRPLQPGEPDAMDCKGIALGLSRFMRNEKTVPPLTLAITGEWGTGKSSVMNLLRHDLVRYGFRPVWFNAWHHQKEEHLLASLLQNVKHQAIPGWLSPEGLLFRANLLWIRGWRQSVPAFLLLAVFAASVVLETRNRGLSTLLANASSLISGEGDLMKILEGVRSNHPLLALLVSGAAIFFTGIQRAIAFSKSPATLMAGMTTGVKLRDLDAQTSFRHRFSIEFSDVTRAFGAKRPMTIFIDDLDRCRPDQILEVLEAVNFLVSSGDCFVIFGMARERVERCVGLSFKDIADETIDEGGDGRVRRNKFARQYLDKLINIEVPLSAPTAEQSRQILQTPSEYADANQAWFTAAGKWARTALPVAMILFALMIGAVAGRVMPLSLFERSGTTDVTASPVAPDPAQRLATDDAPVAENPRKPPDAGQSPELKNADSPVMGAAVPAFLVIALLGSIVVVVLKRPPDLVVKDSVQFQEALGVWRDVIFTAQPTPRSLKRFQNRIRYIAMRERPIEESQSRWQRVVSDVRRRFSPPAPQPAGAKPATIPESLIVAFAAIDGLQPELLRHLDTKVASGDAGFNSDKFALFETCRKAHQSVFGNWEKMASFLPRYELYVRGIRVN